MFFFVRYTTLFCPFTWVLLLLNTLFSFDQSFQSFSFILVRNKFFVCQFSRYTYYWSRHTRKTWTVFYNIYLFWLFCVGTFIRKTVWCNRPWLIYCFYYVFCFSFLRSPWFIQRPWFIQGYTFCLLIADGFIFFTFRFLWFVCFVDGVNFYFLQWNELWLRPTH